MKNFTLLLISGLLYSGLSYAQTDQIYTRPNEKTAKAPEKKISQFMKPVNINPEKPDVPLNKNDAFQKVQKRRVQEKR